MRQREKKGLVAGSSERENWNRVNERGRTQKGVLVRCGGCGPAVRARKGRSGVYNSCPGLPALRRPISSIKLQLGPEAEDVCM